MRFPRLNRWRRSLLVQMYVLTFIFLVFAILYFAVLPYTRFLSMSDPITETRILVNTAILNAINDAEGNSLDTLTDDPDMRKVAEINERFRYFVSKGNRTVQFGSPPKWLGAIDFNLPNISLLKELENPEECKTRGFWRGEFDDDGVAAYVSYRECNGEETYVEYSGIEAPLPLATGYLNSRNLSFLWATSKQSIIASIVFILIAGFVVLMAARSLRRITSIAESFDADRNSGDPLPEKKILTEVLPLVQAINKMVDRVQESQEQQAFFLTMAAHELRTPMAILRTRLEELPDSATKSELRDDVRRITSLVEQLLRLMSIKNKGDLPDEVDLIALARTVIAQRAPLAIDKGVDIQLETATDSKMMKGDQSLLKVALANLLDNAISFSQPGDSLSVEINSEGTISVKDNGPGIAEAEAKSLFEPFSKNPPNREGHGLGLAIVKAIMVLHGGSVSAANTPGDGAVFTLQFSS